MTATPTPPTPPSAPSAPSANPATGSRLWHDAALVFRREFMTRITSTMFLASTGFALFVIVGGILFFSTLDDDDADVVGVTGTQPEAIVDTLPDLADDAGFGAIVVETFESRADLEAAITDGDVRVGVVDGTELLVDADPGRLTAFLSLTWQDARLNELVDQPKLEPTQRQAIAAATAELPVTELNPDPESDARQAVGTALVFMLFFSVQLMGGILVISITEEKGNNIVELLLSSMSSRSLLLGKLAANGLVGLIQMLALIGTTIVAVNVVDLGDLPVIPPSLLVVALVWFIVGFALFGMLIAAAASLAPSQEDAQSVVTPVLALVMVGYFASFYITGNPDALLARVISLVPIVSPFVTPARFLIGDLPWWEHLLALVIAGVSLVAALQIGARVYTRSVIHTDRKLGWLEAFRSEPVR